MVRHSISIDYEVVLVIRHHRGATLEARWHIERIARIHISLTKILQTFINLAIGLRHNPAIFDLVEVRGLDSVIFFTSEPIVKMHHSAEAALWRHWHLVSNTDIARSQH